ncbi:hypothetical protein BSZ39_03600 [Bowdeniella nasicola]|uniref:NADP-dependent oxidoreductase domain-containing protein n=1 Tax=Bowdeniella nasicola TaxID=208480 RepID=A0A1Q5Q4D5_9ACTO|nr:aldo/keto reductase [Bowdeniella nasicola]OKL54552.1 hypothetical protein BSZ39_03600 [Bowdeniella nasicola]
MPYDVGVAAAKKFSGIAAELARDYSEFESATPAQIALRWLIDRDGVSTVIPGARNAEQAKANAAAGSLPALPNGVDEELAALYSSMIKEHVHDKW